MCYDGSPKAKKTLDIVLSLMQKRDKLVTITVKESIIKEEDSVMRDYLK